MWCSRRRPEWRTGRVGAGRRRRACRRDACPAPAFACAPTAAAPARPAGRPCGRPGPVGGAARRCSWPGWRRRPAYARSPCASVALWWMKREMRGERAQSGEGRSCMHRGSTDGGETSMKKRWRVCVNREERRGTGRVRMSTHTHTHKSIVWGQKGRTRKEKLISKAHTGWEAIMPWLLQWVKVKATGRFSSAINIKDRKHN